MSFLKEFKEDLSLAISELLPQEMEEEEETFDTEAAPAEKKEVRPSQEKPNEKKAESPKAKGKAHQKNNEKADANTGKREDGKKDAGKKSAGKPAEPQSGKQPEGIIDLDALIPKEELASEPFEKVEPLRREAASLPNEETPKPEAAEDTFGKSAEEEKTGAMQPDKNMENEEAEKIMDEMMTGAVETENLNLDSMDVMMPGSAPEETVIPETAPRKSSETATITTGTKINGDIESDGSLEILGTIHGNVTCNGKLTVTGTLVGNSNADEVYADSAKIEGEINSAGAVKIGLGSVILGNVKATSAVIAGAIRGDIDVHGPVIVDTSAVVMGNIKSRSVQINNGAVIEGFCSQCYSDVSVKNFFEENKPTTEKKSDKK